MNNPVMAPDAAIAEAIIASPAVCPVCTLSGQLTSLDIDSRGEGYVCGNCGNVFLLFGIVSRFTWVGLIDREPFTEQVWALNAKHAERQATKGDRIFKTIAVYPGWPENVKD